MTQAGAGARLSGTHTADQFYSWVPAAMYPSDVSPIPEGFYDTGNKIAVNSKYADVASASCSMILDYASGPGFGEEAYFIDQGEDSAAKNSYAYGMYEFSTPAQASALVNELAAKFASCGSFTYSNSSGASAPVTLTVGPRSEAAEVTSANTAVDLRLTLTYKGKTDVGDLVFAADGNVVVFATSASTTGTLSTAVDNAKVVQETLSAFTSAEAGGASPSAGASSAAASWTPCVVGGQTVPPSIEYSSPEWEKKCGVTAPADAVRVYSTDAAPARVLAAVGGGTR
ncbi:sensor domain-containing protein [Actinospica sp. MGRD01-02]|uniref:Sensor domain-containing protein n=1 Tax=Actinospica acidithermotolerans TaxID=2828514 RepID=A0A941EBQ8_9ACTN|nr:sensor domain-containing protein [Actinospica acidithermotolerans]MBR7824944.1 sensor domain-containing protein [Actinospica acidithermotolerans]